MKPYYEHNGITIIHADCRDILPHLEPVDLVLTDPPYGLGFMGKKWDSLPPGREVFEECLRALKPGGHLLAFGGTRTYHRMACAVEDAGFEIRDMIEWCYGSGFPKSLNVGKAIDKLQRNEREVVGEGKGRTGEKAQPYSGSLHSDDNYKRPGQFDVTKGNSVWEGWGTALKPAHEPICMARKPLEKGLTIAENVLKWGTGGLNVDGGRIHADDVSTERTQHGGGIPGNSTSCELPDSKNKQPQGRFPANLIHDGSQAVMDLFPESKSPQKPHSYTRTTENTKYGKDLRPKGSRVEFDNYGDSGPAARFFKSCPFDEHDLEIQRLIYQAKASPAERGAANNHPTVKPIALIKYLITMFIKEGQAVVDPFMGSGTTGVACKNLNRNFIGIEIEERYCEIAAKRLSQEVLEFPG